jgi:branched-chain amino acid transport system permease protein
LHAGADLGGALLIGVLSAVALAALFGAAVVRSSGVYLAMLSLALAQVVWATATQAVAWTGGDNGLIGLRLVSDDMRPYFYVAMVALVLAALAALRRLALSGQGAALQALRDAPMRAHASALPVAALKYRVFLYSAALAGLSGALFAAHKGTVFPSSASVATSVDALLVVLLGGVHQLWGAVAGSTLLHMAAALLGRDLPYWRGVLGVVIMLVMLLSPSGLLSALGPAWARLVRGLRSWRRP